MESRSVEFASRAWRKRQDYAPLARPLTLRIAPGGNPNRRRFANYAHSQRCAQLLEAMYFCTTARVQRGGAGRREGKGRGREGGASRGGGLRLARGRAFSEHRFPFPPVA